MRMLATAELQAQNPARKEVWQGHATKFAKISPTLEHVCPFGFFLVRLSHWSSCLLAAWDHSSCDTFRSDPIRITRLVLGAYGSHYGLRPHEELIVFWNTRWSRLFEYWATTMQRVRNWQKPFQSTFDASDRLRMNCDESSEVQV